ncbi:MAG: hypothetical protein ACXWHC_17180, partial [Usitatibacter sp.]
LAAGCAQLLPTAQSEVTSPWHSFDDAKKSIEGIVPGRTSTTELRAKGIDPYANPNVQLLTYSDIVLRFPANGMPGADKLDPGLRECLEAGKACTGYAITVREVQRDRTGPFLMDALNFKRITEVTGWNFNALILLVDDRVVYTLYGGQPLIHEIETTRQPLGPVQGWGDTLPGLMR